MAAIDVISANLPILRELHSRVGQLELAQRSYMDEESREYEASRASRLQDGIRNMLEAAVRAEARQ